MVDHVDLPGGDSFSGDSDNNTQVGEPDLRSHSVVESAGKSSVPTAGTIDQIRVANGNYDGHAEFTEHDDQIESTSHPSRKGSMTAAERARRNTNAKLANPLAAYSQAELRAMGAAFAKEYQIGEEEDTRAFELGACLAQNPIKYSTVQGLEPDEIEVLRMEFTNRWSQPKLLYFVIVLCSTCAAVQGMGKFECICMKTIGRKANKVCRRDRCQWRPVVLRSSIRYWRQRSAIDLAPRFGQLGSLSVLCFHWMLAHCTFQQHFRTSWYNIRHLYFFCPGLLLASVHEHMVAHVHRAIRSWSGYWSQVGNSSDICSRDHSTRYSWCACYAMADVDSVWYHAGICRRPRLLSSSRSSRYNWLKLASHDGFSNDACCHCCLLCLSVPRVSALVSQQR